MKKTLLACSILLGVGMLNTLSAQIVPNGLVAYYPLNGDANDYSGNGNNGINLGAVAAPDRFANASGSYYFDGTGPYIRVESDPAIEPDSFISLSLWVKPQDFTTRQTPIAKRLFHNADPYNSYSITTTEAAGNSNQKWGAAVSSGTMGSGGGCISPNVIDTGAWSHLVLTYDGSNVKLYINGTLASSGAKTGKLGYTDSSLRIGLGIPGSSLQYFKGWIDDVRIYNRAITPTEVSTLYSNTTTLENPSQHTGTWFYPNPAISSLTLTDMAIEDIQLYNMNGQLVDFQRSGSTISLSTLPAGIYVITGNLNGAVLREKLIVNQ